MKILDKGFVELIDHLGNDISVVNAARVSFGKRTSTLKEKDIKLVNYLAKNKHLSPFRHVYLTFHIKAPEFVMRQWYRHCVGIEWTSGEGRFIDHGWNEISGRYVEYEPEFYIPEKFRPQSKDNKQASAEGDLSDKKIGPPGWDDYDRTGIHTVREHYESTLEEAYSSYCRLIDAGVAREQARCVLPVCFYTEIYWTASLQAIANFIKLRNHTHAQWEIQQYAKAIEELTKGVVPESLNALVRYL